MPIVPARAADEADIRRLLEASGLPTADVTPLLLEHFLVLREGASLLAVVGLEPAGDTALLRSLAVADSLRGGGIGRRMVRAAEDLARERGIRSLYLLTTTAHHYFAALGYQHAPRDQAPVSIRETAQFSSLCPSSSFFMVKALAPRPFNVLFLCTGNSARSIMAEAILNHLSGRGRFRAYSAGSHPRDKPHPFAVQLLEEFRLPTDGLRSKSWDEFAQADAPPLDFVFTVCDKAAGEQCPLWPGQPMTAHWGVPDPVEAEGSDDTRRRAFSDAFLVLKRRIDLFTNLPFDSIAGMALEQRLREIGKE
ncbi:arsenic resistance N-acetyltransferase ArsN2 [Nevskia soli]|uniref:arsenic resistance N-acetyltransferase ArsN2 n=1 Tax=Nevskia soli TaxID=418856 RepID=UPI000AAEA5DC